MPMTNNDRGGAAALKWRQSPQGEWRFGRDPQSIQPELSEDVRGRPRNLYPPESAGGSKK